MTWAKPEYRRGRVDAAGRILVDGQCGGMDPDQALAIINNWRSSHAYPLNTFQMALRRAVRHVRPPWLVAQRIKRLPAIKLKLSLNRSMALSQMQDIGGCRAVVATVGQVKEILELYRSSRSKQEMLRITDYITQPRSTGYRSVHVIFRYHSDNQKNGPYNGLRIEMQLRSRLQHAWATAVETTGDFIGQALKSNLGSDEWLRFFKLMASAIALDEGTELVPGTPTNASELRRELRAATRKLNVIGTLQTYGQIAQNRADTARAELFLIATNPLERNVMIRGFLRAQSERAMEQYAATEKAMAGIPGAQVVLVSVDSIKKLKRAYPSYFLESRVFINALRRSIATRAERR